MLIRFAFTKRRDAGKDAVDRTSAPWGVAVRRRRHAGVTVAQRFALTFVSPNLSKGVTSPPAQAKQSGSLAVAVAPVPVPLAWREAGH